MATRRFELLSLFRFVRYYVVALMATTTNAFLTPSKTSMRALEDELLGFGVGNKVLCHFYARFGNVHAIAIHFMTTTPPPHLQKRFREKKTRVRQRRTPRFFLFTAPGWTDVSSVHLLLVNHPNLQQSLKPELRAHFELRPGHLEKHGHASLFHTSFFYVRQSGNNGSVIR